MSYLGRSVDAISNVEKLDNITFNGGTTYALTKSSAAFTPAGANNILISIDGVVQQGNFSVSGSNIVFTFSPTSSNTCDFIMHYGTGLITTPADDTVSTAKIQNDAITVDKLNLISTSSVPSLEAKGDGSSQDGYIQLNCSQNSHGVKLKSPPHSANQSYTLTLPSTAPATDKILQTNSSGVLSFVDAPSGDLVKLAQANSTSNASAITLDSVFSSVYTAYRFVCTLKPVNNDIYIAFRWRDGGSNLTVSQYYGAARGGYVNGSGAGAQSFSTWGDGSLKIGHAINNNNYNGYHLDMLLYPYNNTGVANIGSIDNASNIIYHASYWAQTTERHEQVSGGGTYTQTTVPDGFQIFLQSGDFDGHNYALFGYKG